MADPIVKQHLSVIILNAEAGVPLDEEAIKRIWSSGGKYEVDLRVIPV